VNTPTTTVVQAATQDYQSVADAPKVLEKIQQAGKDLSTMSPADQGLYANLLLASGKYDEAAKVFDHLLGVDPANKDALTALALLAGLKGDTASQRSLIDQLVSRYPSDNEVLNLQAQNALSRGDLAAARSAWEASRQIKESPDALVGLAMLSLQGKKPKDALNLLDRAETLTKNNDLLYSLRSQAHAALGEYLLAETDVSHALALMPDNPWYSLDRARLGWLNLQKPIQALADAEKALSLDATLFYAWEYKAEILESQGKAREAYEAYRKALALEKDFRFSYPAVSVLAFRFQDYPQALKYAHEAAKDYPGEYAFPVIEALSLRFLGRAPEAQTVLEKNQARFPKGTTVNELYRFLLAPDTDFYLNAALTQEKKENIRVRVQFYQACQYVLLKATSSARAGFTVASESRLPGIPEIAAAKDWLDHGF
jgi:tetratricopeptide (TPR) repeat protein